MSDFTPEPTSAAPSSWGQTQGHIPSPNVQATMTQMTTQLQTVIDAAERAAEAIRYDAEEQARHHLAEAQRKADRLTAERVGMISDLTDDLIRHASTVRDHSEQMIRALEDAISSVTTKLEQPALSESLSYGSDAPAAAELPGQTAFGTAPAATPAYSPPAVSQPEPTPAFSQPEPAVTTPAAAPAAAAPAASGAPSEEALLHATRLAVAGNDRATIAAALRESYGVADPDPLVARVLGEA